MENLMITLSCRHIAPHCLDTLSAVDATDMQKIFLDHVHTKHSVEWRHLSKQFKATSTITMRNRFRAQEAENFKETASRPLCPLP
jgi:hypothetical protein